MRVEFDVKVVLAFYVNEALAPGNDGNINRAANRLLGHCNAPLEGCKPDERLCKFSHLIF